jgi:hypothetical protein
LGFGGFFSSSSAPVALADFSAGTAIELYEDPAGGGIEKSVISQSADPPSAPGRIKKKFHNGITELYLMEAVITGSLQQNSLFQQQL